MLPEAFPPAPEASPAANSQAEAMPPAPPLPPLSDQDNARSPAQQHSYPAAEQRTAPRSDPPRPATYRLLAAVAEQHQLITELHEQFLRQQGEFHDRLRNLRPNVACTTRPSTRPGTAEDVLDPATDTWLADHRPSWTVPVLPGTSIADRLARAATDYTGLPVTALRDVQIRRWLTVHRPVRLRTEIKGSGHELHVTLLVRWEADTPALSRYVLVATGTVVLGEQPEERPTRFRPLADAWSVPTPYETGEFFHGPAFQYLVALHTSTAGAAGTLDLSRGTVPRGTLHPGALDAAMHTIPGHDLARWAPNINGSRFVFPHRINALRIFEPLPANGTVEVETRFAGFHNDNPDLPAIDLQVCRHDHVLLDMQVVMILANRCQAPPHLVRAYARDRLFVPDLLLSTTDGGDTVLRSDDVQAADFIPGTVIELYGLPPGTRHGRQLIHIAAKEHVARLAAVHPCHVQLGQNLNTAWCRDQPDRIHSIDITATEHIARVRNAAPPIHANQRKKHQERP